MPSQKLLIKYGTVAHSNNLEPIDILISDQKIVNIGKNLSDKVDRVINAKGKLVLPGGVDSHCHIEQKSASGLVNSDTFYTGTSAAALGGNTTVIPFAAQYDGDSLLEVVDRYHNLANKGSIVDYSMHMIIAGPTDNVIKKELPKLILSGHSSIKLFMTYDRLRIDDENILEILKQARKCGAMVSVHAENHEMITNKVKELLEDGCYHPKYHTDSHPVEGEVDAFRRIIQMSDETKQPVMIFHVSSEQGLNEIRSGKSRGVKFFAETCTQYLTLNSHLLDQEQINDGAKWICSPPIRSINDSEALWKGLEDSTLDLVTSDHAPYSFDNKGKFFKDNSPNFKEIPNGIPGLQWRLPILLDRVLNKQCNLDISDFVRMTSTMPAKVYGLYPHKGEIKIGSDADIVIWDTDLNITLSDDMVVDGSKYNPYSGMKVSCWPNEVILRGTTIVKDNIIKTEAGTGQFLSTKLSEYI
tara:strand:+ start:241 stop:1650 length:1410 start_codon:yes stop_codon:yes gene_type:complete